MITIRVYLYIFFSATLVVACSQSIKQTEANFAEFYEEYEVHGSFVLLKDFENEKIVHHSAQVNQPFTPASTFKICNTLIGLETGVIEGREFVIPWDSVARNPVWDQNHNLESAFSNSVVWYYQEVARNIGPERMKYWLDEVQYGNADTTGGIDQFWLEGGLRITPMEQIEFLQKLYYKQLPFQDRSMNITKEIMLDRDTLGYRIYGKTGWGGQDHNEIGWYVGFVESGDKVFFFSNCIQMPGDQLKDIQDAIRFDQARTEIPMNILENMSIINK